MKSRKKREREERRKKREGREGRRENSSFYLLLADALQNVLPVLWRSLSQYLQQTVIEHFPLDIIEIIILVYFRNHLPERQRAVVLTHASHCLPSFSSRHELMSEGDDQGSPC